MKISKGNSKIGKVWNISLPPVKACKGCADICGRDCYAMKAYRQYPATREAWEHNFDQAKNDIGNYFKELECALEKYKGKFFRWHVAGDILSTEYYYEMIVIAKKFPRIKFLAFTKQYWFVNRFHDQYEKKGFVYTLPENLQIVFSAWPNLPLDNPHGFPVAFMQDGTETRIPDDAIPCPGNCETCGMCWSLSEINRDVYFDKH